MDDKVDNNSLNFRPLKTKTVVPLTDKDDEDSEEEEGMEESNILHDQKLDKYYAGDSGALFELAKFELARLEDVDNVFNKCAVKDGQWLDFKIGSGLKMDFRRDCFYFTTPFQLLSFCKKRTHLFDMPKTAPMVRKHSRDLRDKMMVILRETSVRKANVVNGWKSSLSLTNQRLVGYGREAAFDFLNIHVNLLKIEFDDEEEDIEVIRRNGRRSPEYIWNRGKVMLNGFFLTSVEPGGLFVFADELEKFLNGELDIEPVNEKAKRAEDDECLEETKEKGRESDGGSTAAKDIEDLLDKLDIDELCLELVGMQSDMASCSGSSPTSSEEPYTA